MRATRLKALSVAAVLGAAVLFPVSAMRAAPDDVHAIDFGNGYAQNVYTDTGWLDGDTYRIDGPIISEPGAAPQLAADPGRVPPAVFPSSVEGTIRRVSAEQGFSDPNLLVAVARQESGLRADAVGDAGHSAGAFQENDQGRGRGLSYAQRFDVAAATVRAIREFNLTNRGNSRGQWAANAQRPLNRVGYANSINSMLR